MTPRGLLADAARRLAGTEVASPDHDAAELLAHVLGTTRAALPLRDRVTADEAARFHELVERRAGREPLQHLTGEAHFRHVTLAVGPGVFVPRPETELVAGVAIAEACDVVRRAGSARVVDLCTGSGAIALSVATEVPGSIVHAVELDPGAFAWAQRNCAERVDLRRGDAGKAAAMSP